MNDAEQSGAAPSPPGDARKSPVPGAQLRPGAMVTSNIRLVRMLGQGGMGSVWVAHHLTLETDIAVKFVLPELAQRGSQAATRFSREAKMAAKIKSPHVVQTLDHGWMQDGTPYIAMELLEGESLEDRLERGPLTLEDAKLLVRQVAEVLHRAHALDVVHRDIKPQNLFLIESAYDLFVKVLDFGIARQTQLGADQQMTASGALMGTPLFLSPELVRTAKDADFHADLWALAVTTYVALSGKLPFGGETLGALLIAITDGEFEPIRAARPDLPDAVEAWFSRALDPNQSVRYGSAKDMADAFAIAAGGTRFSQPELVAPVAHAPAVLPNAVDASSVPSFSGAGEGSTFQGAASTHSSTAALPLRRSFAVPAIAVGVVAALGIAGVALSRVFHPQESDGASVQAESGPVEESAPDRADSEPSVESSPTVAKSPKVVPDASSTADPTAAPVPAPATSHAPVNVATAKAPPVEKKPPAPRPAAANCKGDNAFVFKAGKLRIRPECR